MQMASFQFENPFSAHESESHPHACLIFDDLESYRRVAFSYIREGLYLNEKCIMAVDRYHKELVTADFENAGLNIGDLIRRGKLILLDVKSSYSGNGGFDPGRTLAFWQDACTDAVSKGFHAVRVVGEATFALEKPGLEESLIYYENIINQELFPKHPLKSLCVYDKDLYPPEIIKEAIKAHPIFFYNDELFVQNIHYVPPKIYFQKNTADEEIDIWLKNVRKNNENLRELKKSYQRFDLALTFSNEGLWDWDLQTGAVYFSPNWKRMLGYEDHEIRNEWSEWERLTRPEHARQAWKLLDELIKGKRERYEIEFQMRHKNGRWVDILSRGNAAFDSDGRALRVVGTHVDITEQKRVEARLLWQHRKISLNQRIATVFLHSDPDEIYADVLDVLLTELDSAYGFFGYIDENGDLVSPTLSRDVWEKCRMADKRILFPHAEWGGVWGRSLAEKRTIVANEGLRLPKGHVELQNAIAVPIVHGGTLIGQFVVANKDGGYWEDDRQLLESAAAQTAPILNAHMEKIRQQNNREKLEAQLRHAQQMEAIGTLAGGIAHDFNNILASVLGYTELSLEEAEEGSLLHCNLSEVLTAAGRARDLVKQILTLSRREEQEKRPVPVVPLVKESLRMLRSTVPTSIDFKTDYCKEELIVNADPTRIQQVILNLVTNAVHAIREADGVLEIRIAPIHFDRHIDRRYIDIAPGDYVQITVSDTGIGIPAADLNKIFEPYFTTKEKGRGTGLGLSVVHGIVKSHSGHIQVYSEAGKGTTFHVYLPVAGVHTDELQETTEKAPQAKAKEELPGGTESVLLVDDEVPIVSMYQQSLESLGYHVTTRTSSVEALKAFQALPEQFDLVITDMTMPQMTGDKLARAIKEVRPQIPVILCTGFSERVKGHEKHLDIDGILMKPVDKRKMAQTIRRLLDRAEEESD